MSKIIRTPTKATGGITEAERNALARHANVWISRLMRTEACDQGALTRAIKDLYRVSGLDEPRVVIVPSPLVMAMAYGAAAAIWHKRSGMVRAATIAATRDATFAATRDADAAEAGAAAACYALAGEFGLQCARNWSASYQGGAYWGSYDCYLSAMRDVIGLKLPVHAAFDPWERAAIHGTFRVLHREFCIVSDFPEVLKVDSERRPHCEDGPSHRWRDGWELYHWHGVRVPRHWITKKATLDPAEVLREPNVEKRAAGSAIIGWSKMVSVLKRRVIDGDPDSDLGALIELTLPGLDEPGRFLQAKCPRNGTIVEGVPRVSDIDNLPIDTVIAAQAWRIGDPQSEYTHPPKRT